MAINILHIAKQSSKFSAANILGKLASFPVVILLGRMLTPDNFGVVASINLLLQYGNLLNPGFVHAGAREIGHHYGGGDEKGAQKIESLAFGGDIAFTMLVTFIMVLVALFQTRPIYKIGYAVVAATYFAERIKTYYFTANYYRGNFNLVVTGNSIVAFIVPAMNIILVFIIKEYSLLIAPMIGSMFVALFYHTRSPHRISFQFDYAKSLPLLKLGFVLSVGGLIFWTQRLIDRTMIAFFLPSSELGYYFYAITYIMLVVGFLSEIGNVMESMIWQEAGTNPDTTAFSSDIKKLTVLSSLLASISISLLQFGYHFIITVFSPGFAGTETLFSILSFTIFPIMIALIPNTLLSSKTINRPHVVLIVYSAGTAINLLLDLVVVKSGLGLIGIAWVALFSIAGIACGLMLSLKDIFLARLRESAVFIFNIMVPVFVCAAMLAIHRGITTVQMHPVLGLVSSCFLLCIVWIALYRLKYKRMFIAVS